MRGPLTKHRFFFVLAFVAFIYLTLAFLVLPQRAFFSSDEGLKLIQLQSFLRKGWGDLTLDYPGRELDPDLMYVPINNPPPLIRDGKIFAVYPIFFPLLSAPLYSLLDHAGLYLIPLFSGLLTLIITGYIWRLNAHSGSSPILLLGLCTPLFFYSLLFWDHTLGTLLFTSALLLLMKDFQRSRRLFLLLAGVLIGLGIWIRSELYVMGLVMPVSYFVFGRRRFRNVASLCLGIVVALVPLWLFQLVIYGDFLGPHVRHLASLGEELPLTTNRLAIIYYTLLEGTPNPILTFLFVMAFVASILTVRSAKLRTNSALVIIIFATLVIASIPNIVQAVDGRPMGGLIPTTPFLAFGFAGLSGSSWKQRNRFLLALSLAYITLVCLTTPVDPGLQWGPRFLLPVLPPLTIVALDNFQTLPKPQERFSSRSILRLCFLSIVAVSLLLQLSSLRIMYILKTRDLRLIAHTTQIDSPYIVSDEYGYAQYVAPLYYERQFFYVRDQEAYQGLTDTFTSNDVHVFAVVTYPVPHRRVVDPLMAGEGYRVRRLSDQLFEISESEEIR